MKRNIFKFIFICSAFYLHNAAHGMETLTTEQLIDNIADDLLSKRLTFTSQVPQSLFDMFNKSVNSKVRPRLNDDEFVNPKPTDLSFQERHTHLNTLQEKANALYSVG